MVTTQQRDFRMARVVSARGWERQAQTGASNPSPEGLDPATATAEGEDRASDGGGGGVNVEWRPSSKELETRGGEEGTAVGAGMVGDSSALGRGWLWWMGDAGKGREP
jgi:hypothetical protein